MDANDISKRNILTTRTRMKVLNALNAETSKNSEAKMEERRLRLYSRTIEEIVSTEKTFLHQLHLLEKFFMQPLLDRGLVSTKQFNVIFGSIEGIRLVNQELLSQLETDCGSVGKAFLELAPYLKMYCSYASSFEEAVALVQKLAKDNKEFASFLQNQETRPEVAMKITSLLITPIQRVPRYKLLLEELMQHTSPESEDFKHLQSAGQEITCVANHINERIREHDNMQKILSIQGSLVDGQPKIVIPGRQFIKEGPLMKVSRDGGSSHQRIFFLFSDMLMYCKQHGTDYGRPSSLSCSCILPIKHCSVESLFDCGKKHGTLIKLTCKEDTLLVYTDNAEVGDSWVDAIRSAVRQYSEFRQTLRKASSAKRPLRRAAILKQKVESLSQLQLKRKLEKLEQETPPECSAKDSLFPMRHMCKVQKKCLTPHTKTRTRLPSRGKSGCQTPWNQTMEFSNNDGILSDGDNEAENRPQPPTDGVLRDSLIKVEGDAFERFGLSSESASESQGSSTESSTEVVRLRASTMSLMNPRRLLSTSKPGAWNNCVIL